MVQTLLATLQKVCKQLDLTLQRIALVDVINGYTCSFVQVANNLQNCALMMTTVVRMTPLMHS